PRFVSFKKGDKYYLIRLTDLRKFALPFEGNMPTDLSGDGKKAIFSLHKPHDSWDAVTIWDLETRKGKAYKNRSLTQMSPDGKQILLQSDSDPRTTILVDLITMAERNLPNPCQSWSPNSRWAYDIGFRLNDPYYFYNIQTGQDFGLDHDFEFEFVGRTD